MSKKYFLPVQITGCNSRGEVNEITYGKIVLNTEEFPNLDKYVHKTWFPDNCASYLLNSVAFIEAVQAEDIFVPIIGNGKLPPVREKYVVDEDYAENILNGQELIFSTSLSKKSLSVILNNMQQDNLISGMELDDYKLIANKELFKEILINTHCDLHKVKEALNNVILQAGLQAVELLNNQPGLKM